jgi:preprotein translocase subunit SecD
LLVLVVLVILLFGAIGIGAAAGKTGFLPKFALDLEGGTELVLTPQASESNAQVTDEQLDQAKEIIEKRVNASGVTEAEVARQGSSNIVVSIPGDPSQESLDLVTKSAKMTFRTVLYVTGATPDQGEAWSTRYYPNPSYTPSPEPSAEEGETGEEGEEGETGEEPSDGAETETGETTPTTEESVEPSPTASSTSPSPAPTPTSKVDASTGNMPVPPDEAYTARLDNGLNDTIVYGAVAEEYAKLLEGAESTIAQKTATGITEEAAKAQTVAESINCSMVGSSRGNDPSDPDKPLVTCDEEGTAAYILGPVMVQGSELTKANNGMATTQQGNTTGQWIVDIAFNSAGGKQFGAVTTKLDAACKANAEDPKRQFAIVLDDLVISAPEVCNDPILTGEAQISGSFTQQTSKTLADQLSFGSLPINFVVQSQDQISATAGSEQLEIGLWAGLIGLILVAVYSFFQYRALSGVTVLSLILAIGISYGTIVLLGWTQGYRLSLAGVAGLIIAIGITADSFIVYFERIRDELRVGRPIGVAVEMAWLRARRTIWASDAVNFLAAIVLYMVAVGGVRGFAFTLGLTTVMDLVVVMLFTHPVVLLATKTRFWGEGHPWSGLDPFRLGAPGAVRYVGRGRFAAAADADRAVAGAGSGGAVAVLEDLDEADDLAEEDLAEVDSLTVETASGKKARPAGTRPGGAGEAGGGPGAGDESGPDDGPDQEPAVKKPPTKVAGDAGLSIAERKRRAAQQARESGAEGEGGDSDG